MSKEKQQLVRLIRNFLPCLESEDIPQLLQSASYLTLTSQQKVVQEGQLVQFLGILIEGQAIMVLKQTLRWLEFPFIQKQNFSNHLNVDMDKTQSLSKLMKNHFVIDVLKPGDGFGQLILTKRLNHWPFSVVTKFTSTFLLLKKSQLATLVSQSLLHRTRFIQSKLVHFRLQNNSLISSLAGVGSIIRVSFKQRLYQFQSESDNFYIVISGEIGLFSTSKQNSKSHKLTLRKLSSGDFFGQQIISNCYFGYPKRKRKISAQCQQQAELLVVKSKHLTQIICDKACGQFFNKVLKVAKLRQQSLLDFIKHSATSRILCENLIPPSFVPVSASLSYLNRINHKNYLKTEDKKNMFPQGNRSSNHQQIKSPNFMSKYMKKNKLQTRLALSNIHSQELPSIFQQICLLSSIKRPYKAISKTIRQGKADLGELLVDRIKQRLLQQ